MPVNRRRSPVVQDAEGYIVAPGNLPIKVDYIDNGNGTFTYRINVKKPTGEEVTIHEVTSAQ